MKKVALILSVFFFACTLTTFAQLTDKQLSQAVKDKASKTARKEAKKYEKGGWEVPKGGLPIAKVLDAAWEKQYQVDDKGNPKYIVADGAGIAGNRSAAEMQAIELGKIQLAGLLETKIASLVSANVANTELAAGEAQSITEVVQSSKNIIAKELGYINPFFKIYRLLGNGNTEVQVRLFYDASTAMDITKKAIKKELKEKLQTNEEDLKKLMGM